MPSAPNPSVKLLLTAVEAAQSLSISPRTLWTLTHRGELPCVRVGVRVLYDVDDLRAWINRRKEVCCGQCQQ